MLVIFLSPAQLPTLVEGQTFVLQLANPCLQNEFESLAKGTLQAHWQFGTHAPLIPLYNIYYYYNNVYRNLLELSRHASASGTFVSNDIPNFEALLRKS